MYFMIIKNYILSKIILYSNTILFDKYSGFAKVKIYFLYTQKLHQRKTILMLIKR